MNGYIIVIEDYILFFLFFFDSINIPNACYGGKRPIAAKQTSALTTVPPCGDLLVPSAALALLLSVNVQREGNGGVNHFDTRFNYANLTHLLESPWVPPAMMCPRPNPPHRS